ncbi:glycosyltransferase [Roseomonas stagni]|uniref:Glycosyltransferase n=1 Tax=Falsiroseomonas algicola TaxID=2716930 RepID=A0A6M1LLG7_9PROT|nr:TIGR04283 family arsenosugar biosynthesis glycosyltransferase [Falsiroseomonas algicola]NGM21168.1 glycosyltransferase [Falsiroseomonas algicola]
MRIEGLSIVIPALNAAASLPGTLAALGTQDIVVADAGSADATAAVAATAGAQVVQAPRGRGSQIAAGIEAAAGPWLLLLHADTRLSPGWQEAVRRAMRDPSRAWHFRFALDDDSPAARRLERAVAWRCRVLRLPYGDQGLLIHRDLLRAVGGMRPLPLMEDVDLVRRLGRSRIGAMEVAAVTSAARFRREGYLRRSARNLFCLALWFAGVSPATIQKLYRGRG